MTSYQSKCNIIVAIVSMLLSATIYNSPPPDRTSPLHTIRGEGYNSASDLISRKDYLVKKNDFFDSSIKKELDKISNGKLILYSYIEAKTSLISNVSDAESWRSAKKKAALRQLLKKLAKSEITPLLEVATLQKINDIEVKRLEEILTGILHYPEKPKVAILPDLKEILKTIWPNWRYIFMHVTQTAKQLYIRNIPRQESFIARSFPNKSGKLILPTSGPISKLSGEPFTKDGVPWEGILVRNTPGEPVKAVGSGKVVFAADFGNLKNLIILDHGNGYLTLYGNIEKLLVTTEMSVAYRQDIGISPTNDENQMNGIYFEIRKYGEPVDPEIWLSH